ncbi:MAG: SLC13 family permease [Candidatus Methanomethyliaceae archaeon]|nr:SLC13 family permease [Candidatus Methanomethyliaceae archaeon]
MKLPDYRFYIGLGIIIYLTIALIARSKKTKIPVWSIMAFSSAITVLSGLVSVDEVRILIDLDVILFLIGMFSIVSLAEQSGLLAAMAYFFASRFKSRHAIIHASALIFGIMAAFATNDAVALMGPPIAYVFARAANINLKVMFLLLAFSLTIGSVMTPIGNPQNILIAVKSGMNAPFIFFMVKLLIPTLLNLLATSLLIIKIFKVKNERINFSLVPHEAIKDKRDAMLSGMGLSLTIIALVINDIFELLGMPFIAQRGTIPFIIAAGMYVLTSEPRKSLSKVDWGTIVFFITMFITMEGVWRSGVLQPLLGAIHSSKSSMDLLSIFTISIVFSQVLSNVPLVNFYIDYMKSIGYNGQDVAAWLALACSSTIAGNLTLLGAASNIIILEVLECRYSSTITFMEFLRIGFIVTLLNICIYIPFLL